MSASAFLPSRAIGCLTTVLFCVATPLCAQQTTRGFEVGGPPRKSALIVGMEKYPKVPLQNTLNDGRDIASALKGLGFDVELLLDVDHRGLVGGIDRWIAGLKGVETALFFYSGHGIQVDGENFVVPLDFDAKDEADAKYQGYSLERIHERMLRAGSTLNILIVDACRNNPFARTRSTGGGLAAMNAGKGSFIAFATSPGSVASDNQGERNGLFTKHLLKAIQIPDLDIGQVFDRVRTEVYRESGDRQLPWTSSSVIGTFMFRSPGKDNKRTGSQSDEIKSAEATPKQLDRPRQAQEISVRRQTPEPQREVEVRPSSVGLGEQSSPENVPVFVNDLMRVTVGQFAVNQNNTKATVNITIENVSGAPMSLAIAKASTSSGGCEGTISPTHGQYSVDCGNGPDMTLSDDSATEWRPLSSQGLRLLEVNSSTSGPSGTFSALDPSQRVNVLNTFAASGGRLGTEFSFSLVVLCNTSSGPKTVSIGLTGIKPQAKR